MANKNTKKLRIAIRAAGKAGHSEYEHSTPVRDYHNRPNDSFRANPTSCMMKQQFPTARVNDDGVNSVNRRRNSCQRVYLNRLDGGMTQSLTAHEPFLRHEHMTFANHFQYRDFEYRRPNPGPTVSQVSV